MADVLAIGPHPDDVELAAGGTVARLIAAGCSVLILDLTRGERATRGTLPERAREAAEAASRLGATRAGLELPDGGLDARNPAQLGALVAAFREHRPRLVLTLHGRDDHPDHREGAELVARAAYLSGLVNYPGAGSPAAPFRPERILYAMGRRTFTPSLVVDVTAVYDAKRAALAAYGTQFHRGVEDPLRTPISDPEFLPRLEARDRFYGGMIGAAFGEPFFEEGPVRIRDVGDLLGRGGR